MNLTLRQLRAFRSVMETGSISRAAQALLLSQPAVTKIIQGMEMDVGLCLFVRERQRLTPTAEAKILMNEVDSLFGNLDRVNRVAKDLQSLAMSSLTLATMPTAGVSLLPRVLTEFQAAHPGWTHTMHIRSSPKLIELAIAQQFDVGLSLLPVDHHEVMSIPVLSVEALVVLPQEHRLSCRQMLTPEDFRGENFISLGMDDRAVHMIDEVFNQAGVFRRIVARVGVSTAACEYVRSGAGLTIIDSLTANAHAAEDLVKLPLMPKINFDVHLLLPLRRPHSIARTGFLKALHRRFASGLPNAHYYDNIPFKTGQPADGLHSRAK